MKKFYTIILLSVIAVITLLLSYVSYKTGYDALSDSSIIAVFIAILVIYIVFMAFEINRASKLDNYRSIYNKFINSYKKDKVVIQKVSLKDAAQAFSYYAYLVVEDYELKNLLKDGVHNDTKRIDTISLCYMIGISSHIIANKFGISYVTPFLKECYMFLSDSYNAIFIDYLEVMDSYINKASSIMHYEANSMRLEDILKELNDDYLYDLFGHSEFTGEIIETSMKDINMFYDMSDKFLSTINIK